MRYHNNYINNFIIFFEIFMFLLASGFFIQIHHNNEQLFLLILFIVINLYIGYYLNQKDRSLFQQQLISERELALENDKNNAIFNLQKAIIIVRDEINMSKANDAFFNTFHFTNIQDFLEKYNCICDLFIEKKGVPHLMPIVKGMPWVEYITKHPNEVHEAYMLDKHHRERVYSVELKENVYDTKTMVVFTDITEIKNHYDTFRRLFESSADGLLLIKEKQFIAVNNTLVQMLNYKNKNELLHINPLKLLPMYQPNGQLSKAFYKEKIAECCLHGFSNFEAVHHKATDEACWFDIALTKIKIKDEEVIHARWRDIDTYKKLQISLEEQVEKQAKALITGSRLAAIGEMMENITHQWKQPLSVILNLVSLLKLTLKDNPDLLIIEEQTSYLNNTITDFNSFSTSSVQEKSYFDLKKSIEVTLNIFEFQAKSSKIDIRLDIEETATIQGNIGKFNQAFLVLLSNAKDALIDDHTKTERIINISTKTNHNDEIILTISDNGGGIALEIIDKIFEPYFTTKFKDKGTGIGLSMTYNIIQKMNGKIEVNNNKEGAVFTIILPKFKPKENTYAN